MTRWITNLESLPILEERLTEAKARGNKWEIERAKYSVAQCKNTMAAVEHEHPGYSVGEPMATEWKSAELIAQSGIVGLYKPGAGN